jgi:hypothetical protein
MGIQKLKALNLYFMIGKPIFWNQEVLDEIPPPSLNKALSLDVSYFLPLFIVVI